MVADPTLKVAALKGIARGTREPVAPAPGGGDVAGPPEYFTAGGPMNAVWSPQEPTEESAALLTTLATPQIRPGPAVELQKRLVPQLEELFQKAPELVNLGGILIERIPASDQELIDQAELVPLPTAGGFISAGGVSRFPALKEHGLDRLVVENTLRTMVDARQIEYLRAARLPNVSWKILVEAHYFRARDKNATGFHKDTQGETLFVNLNYHIDKQVIGPEYVVNPAPSREHDEAVTLPEQFRADLNVTRQTLGEPTTIEAKLVDPYSYVAFVDEAIHHGTPLYAHRSITGSELRQALEKRYPAAFADVKRGDERSSGVLGYAWSFEDYLKSSKNIKEGEIEKWQTWWRMASAANAERKYTRWDFQATMTDDEFDRLLETVGTLPGADRRGAAGFYAASIPKAGTSPLKPDERPPLKRRLSDANFRKQMPPPLPENDPRRFFRTWVRAIPAAKAEDLRKRLAN
jgi:hypothetical protein